MTIFLRNFRLQKRNVRKIRVPFFFVCRKILVFPRLHADRAKSAVLGTRISRRQEALAKRRERKKKAQKLHRGRSRLHGYFGFVNGENAGRRTRSFSSLSFDPRRRAKPHKGNIADRVSTASSPRPSSPPRFPLSLSLTLSLYHQLPFFTRFPPCSSRLFPPPPCFLRHVNLFGRYVQIDARSSR